MLLHKPRRVERSGSAPSTAHSTEPPGPGIVQGGSPRSGVAPAHVPQKLHTRGLGWFDAGSGPPARAGLRP